MGYVYLIGSTTFGWYKIGKSKIPDIRVKDIGILLPFRIKVLAVWRAENHTLLEALLHEKYLANAVNGEWFYFTKAMARKIVQEAVPVEARIYPTDSSDASMFALFSNMAEDKFVFDHAKISRHGKVLTRSESKSEDAQLHWANKRAVKDWLFGKHLPDTLPNRRLARETLNLTWPKAKNRSQVLQVVSDGKPSIAQEIA